MGIYTYSEEEIKENNNDTNNHNNNINANENIKKKNISKENNDAENNKEKNKDKKQIHDNDIHLNKEEIEYMKLEKKIPENIKLIIEKMANYIARNGSEFETLVRQKNIGDERFSFMQPWNEFYNYYKYKINKCSITFNQNKVKKLEDNENISKDNIKVIDNSEKITSPENFENSIGDENNSMIESK
ncbi:hypothetical protein PIROE2DRAFT_2472, partial [Piromyces sp. E2]